MEIKLIDGTLVQTIQFNEANIIDVHIAMHPAQDRGKWLTKCIESLQNEPVNVRIFIGLPRRIGASRRIGYKLGVAPYICHIDDDDYIEPGIFQKIEDKLVETDFTAGAVYSKEVKIDEEGNILSEPSAIPSMEPMEIRHAAYMHHVVVLKRSIVEDFLDNNEIEDKAIDRRLIHHIVGKYPVYCIQEIGYYWRIHQGNSYNNAGIM